MKKTVITLAASAAAVALAAAPASAAAPTPFVVRVATTGVLTSAHKMVKNEVLLVGSHRVTLGDVTRPGGVGTWIAHTTPLLAASQVGHNYLAIPVG